MSERENETGLQRRDVLAAAEAAMIGGLAASSAAARDNGRDGARLQGVQNVDLPGLVIDGIEHDVGIADDRQFADTGHFARPGAVGKIAPATRPAAAGLRSAM